MRKRKARAAMVAFLGLGAILIVQLFAAQPRELVVELRFGEERMDVRRATLSYRRQNELVRTAVFNYGKGAPATQRHKARLPEGRYQVDLDLNLVEGHRRMTQTFEAEEGRTVILDLGSAAP